MELTIAIGSLVNGLLGTDMWLVGEPNHQKQVVETPVNHLFPFVLES
jgi:hypothetical protein